MESDSYSERESQKVTYIERERDEREQESERERLRESKLQRDRERAPERNGTSKSYFHVRETHSDGEENHYHRVLPCL